MEKRTSARQKIALERIWRLFELAERAEAEKKGERAKRYLRLAKRIGEKTNAGIPKELKERFCRKCFSLKVVAKEERPFLAVRCAECGSVKRYGLEEKSGKGGEGEKKGAARGKKESPQKKPKQRNK